MGQIERSFEVNIEIKLVSLHEVDDVISKRATTTYFDQTKGSFSITGHLLRFKIPVSL